MKCRQTENGVGIKRKIPDIFHLWCRLWKENVWEITSVPQTLWSDDSGHDASAVDSAKHQICTKDGINLKCNIILPANWCQSLGCSCVSPRSPTTGWTCSCYDINKTDSCARLSSADKWALINAAHRPTVFIILWLQTYSINYMLLGWDIIEICVCRKILQGICRFKMTNVANCGYLRTHIIKYLSICPINAPINLSLS